MSFRFAEPWAFAALGLILVWIVASAFRRARAPAVRLPVFRRAAGVGGSWRAWAGWPATAARVGALSLLAVALARPQNLIPHTETARDALAIQLVVDRSGSMEEPTVLNGERMNRLEAVKRVVRRFVLGDGRQLAGRQGDLLGLIVFGTYADTLMPLTTSHEALVEALDRVSIATHPRERSTAIGDALVLANARLRASETALQEELKDPGFRLKSKAIVLLTDGENRAGVYSPEDAARLAAEWGVKIYIIAIRDGSSQLLPGGVRQSIGQAVNEREMQAVAEHTGGRFWGVDDMGALAGIYAQIDELERTEVRVNESTEVRDLFHGFAVWGVGLLGLELVLRGVAGGRLP